jgi:hypothetical protein
MNNDAMNAWIRARGRRPLAGPTASKPASAATCRNLTVAGKVADALGLIDDHGEIDWQALGEEAPEFFAPTSLVPNAHAGAGTGTPGPDTRSFSQRMSDAIRRASGRWM